MKRRVSPKTRVFEHPVPKLFQKIFLLFNIYWFNRIEFKDVLKLLVLYPWHIWCRSTNPELVPAVRELAQVSVQAGALLPKGKSIQVMKK